jgi:hypothetical protein
MIDYNNGNPNARYWVLKLIKDSFHPGDNLVANGAQATGSSEVMIQGFLTAQGKKALLVNKTNSERTVKVSSDFENAGSLTVDEATGDEEPRAGKADGTEIKLAPFAVTVLSGH